MNHWYEQLGLRTDGGGSMGVQSAKESIVDRKAYELAMRVFRATKSFPREEQFALTSQIRRSFRSMCLNLREAWAKRRYEGHFLSKLTDCDAENAERDSSLDFAKDCELITPTGHAELTSLCDEVGRMLGSMLRNSEPFLLCIPHPPPPP